MYRNPGQEICCPGYDGHVRVSVQTPDTAQLQSVCGGKRSELGEIIHCQLRMRMLLQFITSFRILKFPPVAFLPDESDTYKRSRDNELQRFEFVRTLRPNICVHCTVGHRVRHSYDTVTGYRY